jgi:uncharacterized protein DUF4234
MNSRFRRPWLVIVLSFLSLGVYHLYWMGVTWWELKRQLNDNKMHPIGHVIGLLMPLYGLLVWDRHFQRLDSIFRESGIATRGRFSLRFLIDGVVGCSFGGGLAAAAVQESLGPAIAGVTIILSTLAASILFGRLLFRSQVGLNAFWHSVATVQS